MPMPLLTTGNLGRAVHHRGAYPVEWNAPLAARARSAREDDRLALTEAPLQHVEHHLVIYDGVCVVHPHRVGAIMEDDLRVRYPLTKVRLHGHVRLISSAYEGICGERTLKVSTPKSSNASSLFWYQFLAAGFVTSTTPSPGCHRSHLPSHVQDCKINEQGG